MCVCVCRCVYACMHVCMYVCMHVCMCTDKYKMECLPLLNSTIVETGGHVQYLA